MKKDFLKKFYIFCFVKKLYLNFDVKKHVELKKCTSKVINFSTVIARCRFNVLQKMRGLYLIGVKRIWRIYCNQGWEFAHSLICSFRSNQMSDCERFAQIAQDKWATVSESLRSLRGNERPWANRSGRSRQMSDHERFAQVAQRKWANERFAQKMLAKKI